MLLCRSRSTFFIASRGERARADAVQQLLERVGESLHALALERLGHVVVVDADVRESLEQRLRLVDAPLERRARSAMVLKREDRLLRQRVDGFGADELLDVQ